jgi:hypothetical protein
MFDWKRMSVNVITAYVVSWAVFFIFLQLSTSILGKIIGTIVLYTFSWILFVGIIAFAERDMLARASQIIGMAKNIGLNK